MALVLDKARARAGLLVAGLVLGCDQVPGPVEAAAGADADWPAVLHDEGYVGPAACAECHAENHASWYASYHRRMTQAASPDAILAPFQGRTPVDTGAAWQLEREGDEFFATPTSGSGDRSGERMRVLLTTGSHHYQMYWLAAEELGGLLALPFVWHVDDQSWEPRRSLFLTPPHIDTAFEFDRWQKSCIKCHTTNGTPEHPGAGAPRVAEFGISCEACHGPGAQHVELRRELAAQGETGFVEQDFIIDPSTLSHERSAMVCGQCHGITPFRSDEERESWKAHGLEFRPGDDLAHSRELLRGRRAANSAALLAALDSEAFDELFWPDGEVRVSGREYNGLVESPCYQRGEMSCLSCHEMHPSDLDPRSLATWAVDQLAPGMAGSAACTSCHAAFASEERLAAHTHHASASSGSECMNCHMPYTTYGLAKAIRSHTITSPDAATSLATGRPNACNLCHLDRSLGWAADRLSKWYEKERPQLAVDDEEVSAAVLLGLSGDAGQRALIAWALGWEPAREVSGTSWMPYLLSALLIDSYDAIARVAQTTARLDPRYAGLTLDFTLRDSRRAAPVADGIMADWLRAGLSATREQRAAVLVGEDGLLDDARVQALLLRRDDRDVSLAE